MVDNSAVSDTKDKNAIPHSTLRFTRHPAPPTRFGWVTSLTFGTLTFQYIRMDRGRYYLVDIREDREVFVYDTELVSRGQYEKSLWKLGRFTIKEYESIQVDHVLNVHVSNIPCFDEKFPGGPNWVTLSYDITVQLSLDRNKVGWLREQPEPELILQNAIHDVARQVLPFYGYQEAQMGKARAELFDDLSVNSDIKKLGLSVSSVGIGHIEGSQKLAESMAGYFGQILTDRAERENALAWGELEGQVDMYLSKLAPGKALEAKGRAAQQLLELGLLQGMSPLESYQLAAGAAARDPQKLISKQVAVALLAPPDPDDEEAVDLEFPPVEIPQGKTHNDRLDFEHEILKKRIPHLLEPSPAPDRLAFRLPDRSLVTVIWPSPTAIPQMFLNDDEISREISLLKEGLWDYEKISVWDLFWKLREKYPECFCGPG